MSRARLWYVSGLGFDEGRASISILVHSLLPLCGASARCPDENGERSLWHLREENERRGQNNGLAVACLASAFAARLVDYCVSAITTMGTGEAISAGAAVAKVRFARLAGSIWAD